MLDITGRAYIVTGGSKGLGFAIAETLVANGARVGLVGRNKEHLQKARDNLGRDNAYAAALDIGNRQDISDCFADIKAHFGCLDGLVNNAGLARPARIDEMDEAEVAIQINTNFLGTVFCAQAVIPLLGDSDNPRIINISSASAEHHDEMSHLSIYTASKAAVERFSRDLRKEVQSMGIGVTILRPGSAPSEFATDWNMERLKHAVSVWQEQGAKMDSGMQGEHVGEAVSFCLRLPPGVSVDLLEIRPNASVDKPKF